MFTVFRHHLYSTRSQQNGIQPLLIHSTEFFKLVAGILLEPWNSCPPPASELILFANHQRQGGTYQCPTAPSWQHPEGAEHDAGSGGHFFPFWEICLWIVCLIFFRSPIYTLRLCMFQNWFEQCKCTAAQCFCIHFFYICTATVQFVCIHMWICVGVDCRKKGLRQILYHIQKHENSECRAPSVLIHVVAPNK